MRIYLHVPCFFNLRTSTKINPDTNQKPDCAGDSRIANKDCQNITKVGKQKERLIGRAEKLGYCEICQVNFPDLIEHIKSGIHQEKITVEDTWKELDDCMSIANSFYTQLPHTNDMLECSVEDT